MKKYIHFSFENFITERVSPVIVLILFHFNEVLVNKFFFKFYKHVGFIGLHERINKTNNFLDDFSIKTKGLKKNREINIVMRGVSASKVSNNINYKLPTFYVNVYKKGEADESIYISGDSYICEKMKKHKLHPIILVNSKLEGPGFINSNEYCLNGSKHPSVFQKNEKLKLYVKHKTGDRPLGSGIMAIACLAKVANKVNIYGYDMYFTSHIDNISYFQCLMSIYKTPNNNYRRLNLMAEKFINLYYIKRIIQDEKFSIYSLLTKTDCQVKLLAKIDRMLCKD
jgi:hypothetical protein